jgi:hypothetical protein
MNLIVAAFLLYLGSAMLLRARRLGQGRRVRVRITR